MNEHSTKDQCELAFADQFAHAVQQGKWMAAVWTIEHGQVVVRRTTCEFPRQDFEPAVATLKNELDKELNMAAVPKPLPTGAHLLRLMERMPKVDVTEQILAKAAERNGNGSSSPPPSHLDGEFDTQIKEGM